MAPEEDSRRQYKQEMDRLRSLELVSVIKSAQDIDVRKLVDEYRDTLDFSVAMRHDLMVEDAAWQHILDRGYAPARVFCHPQLLKAVPSVSLYYRGITGLSRKSVGQMAKSVDKAETDPNYKFRRDVTVHEISRLYNLFISSIILGTGDWALENGYRTILATMGITFDGSSRNRVGAVAEERIRKIILEYALEVHLLHEHENVNLSELKMSYKLRDGYTVKFSDEPDVYFTDSNGNAVATIEIKGGLDPAGALERLGAAQRSFLHAIRATASCKTYLVAGVITNTMESRLANDRNFTKHFSMVEILTDVESRATFLREIFHYGLRLVD